MSEFYPNQTVKHAYDMPCSKIKGWKCDVCGIEHRWKKDMIKHIESIHEITVREKC